MACETVQDVVPALPDAGSALQITLPGGLVVEGVSQQMGADAMTNVRALIGAANTALAPLGPIFTIIDVLIAVKEFASSVPDVVLNPGSVVEKVTNLIAKASKLLGLVPQLSVPIMILNTVDAIIALVNGLADEMDAIAEQAERIEEARALQTEAPCLEVVLDDADAQMAQHQANVAASLESVEPLIQIINTFADIVGLPKIELEVDTSGSPGDAAQALRDAADLLTTFRGTIPV